MTVKRVNGQPGPPPPVRLPLPPTLFAMAMLTGVAALGLPRLIGAHMTRDPMGKATELGITAMLAIPLALALASARPQGLLRLFGRAHAGELAVRGLAKAGFLIALFAQAETAGSTTLLDYTGYVAAAVIAAFLFGARTPLRDKLALGACFLCTVGMIVIPPWFAAPSPWPGGAIVVAIFCLGLFVALTHRLAPRKGIATLLFWDAAVILIALLALLRAGMVEWDGGPWNQMAGVVAAALVANLIWLAAYAHAPVSRLAPFEYLALPMLLGVGLLFGQSYPLLLLIGFLAVVPICALLALCEILLVYGRDGADA